MPEEEPSLGFMTTTTDRTAGGRKETVWVDEPQNSPILSPGGTKFRKGRRICHLVYLVIFLVIGGITALVIVTTSSSQHSSPPHHKDDELAANVAILKLPVFKYACTENQCVYQNLTKAEVLSGVPTMGDGLMSLRVCEMTCGNGSMLPMPQSIAIASKPGETVAVDVTSFSHHVTTSDSALVKAMQAAFNEHMAAKLKLAVGGVQDKGASVNVVGTIASASTALGLDTDESYEVSIAATTVTITAKTAFGYRHGLASVVQLVDWCDVSRSFRMVKAVTIQDKPAYKYRGVMLDTARNFHSMAAIKRLVRTMGMHKLNMFHWHITDSSSFPIEIKFEPKFNLYGNYQSDMAYSQANVRDIVAYAKTHGVQVIPEVDAPAHAGAGWQWGPDYDVGELTLCWANNPLAYNECYEAPCGQLNPMNEHVYGLLDKVWVEMADMFESDVLHMGGDEVFTKCWKRSPVVSDAVANTTDDAEYFEISAKFQERVQTNLWKHAPSRKVMLWSSELTSSLYSKYLPKDKIIVHTWAGIQNGNEPRHMADAGYQYVASFQDRHYLDCGHNGIDRKDNGWCAPYKTWQVIYEQVLNPNITEDLMPLALGGELVLWTEVSGEASMDVRIWPRAAALAERAWTNPTTRWDKAMARMTIATYRVVESGSGSDLIQPHWCRQHPGECPLIVWPL
ncbi:hypothetical protein H257_09230 [Aphanomyces astaci]|uniref:beta-N-acetylhexosaminidase n=1 Tax=Aphanomyces astaci TaxID=112090 RepID=W4GCU4_APHAT|nr:hypothetical protein H257_09230 [Aphanomyces astaci]ETV76773.1 hypothetical protein H257_09230 [Aphanomyces astaci]RQM23700.1 hypothetical protein B5M09_003074 [Aphanomyces astaci]|eukprot:XP_009833685.1 hypothetical protein H257_09230 [Aphanomyces astaci]